MKKDKILLIIPFFMGYQKILQQHLSEKYAVTLIDGDKYIPKIRKQYEKHKIIRHIGYRIKKIEDMFKEMLINNGSSKLIDDEILKKQYKYIVVINGHGISDESYINLKKNNKEAKFILYLWDDITNLFKKSHIKYFDQVYSYNIDDCEYYKFKYLPMFVSDEDNKCVDKNIDISFIASAHSDRIPFAKKIDSMYGEKYKLYFYFYDPDCKNDFYNYKSPLSYKEYINILKRSKITIDLPYASQGGPTTRVCDSISTKTKIITSNKKLKRYPFYSQNIYFIDRNNPVIDEKFINEEYKEINFKAVNVAEWIDALKL